MLTFSRLLVLIVALTASFAEAGPRYRAELEQKLAHYWSKYDAAKSLLVSRWAGEAAVPVSRRELETVLSPSAAMAFTAQELEELRSAQRRRIVEAKAAALARSIVDLDFLRKLPPEAAAARTAEFCATIPKGGMLHVHPFGTLNRETVTRELTRNNPVLSPARMRPRLAHKLYPEERQWVESLREGARFSELAAPDQKRFIDFSFLPSGNHPFPRFDAAFVFLSVVVNQSYDSYREAFLDFGRRASREGVLYVEFTQGLDREELPFAAEVVRRLRSEFGIHARFNYSFYRLSSPQDQLAELRELTSFFSPLIVGIDLLGDETETPALEQGQAVYSRLAALRAAGKSTLHRTMHAGELGHPSNPRDALLLGAERLGHGVQLASDPIALEYAARHAVPIEINLTSNLRLRSVSNLKTHPFLEYLRLGLPVSLSTDDEGIFETSISRECELAVLGTDVTYDELKSMAFNAITTAFVDDPTKAALSRELKARFSAFEKQWRTEQPERP